MKRLKYIFILFVLPHFYFSNVSKGQTAIAIKDPVFKQYFVDSLPLLLNVNNELIIDSALVCRDTINCTNLGISEVPELVYFKKSNSFILNQNQIKSIPDLDELDSLSDLQFIDNQVETFPQINKSTILGVLCANNKLVSLSPLYGSTLVGLVCGGNYLTFEDILPLKDIAAISYTPQNTVSRYTSIKALEKENLEIKLFDDTVSTSTFTLFKGGIAIDSIIGQGSFVFQNIDQDLNGQYYIEVKNSILFELTLSTNIFNITVVPDDEAYFSPNGDNVEDTFFLDMSGTLSIYSRSGELITTLQGPNEWDGTDANGSLLPTDAYIIQSQNGERLILSIIR